MEGKCRLLLSSTFMILVGPIIMPMPNFPFCCSCLGLAGRRSCSSAGVDPNSSLTAQHMGKSVMLIATRLTVPAASSL